MATIYYRLGVSACYVGDKICRLGLKGLNTQCVRTALLMRTKKSMLGCNCDFEYDDMYDHTTDTYCDEFTTHMRTVKHISAMVDYGRARNWIDDEDDD